MTLDKFIREARLYEYANEALMDLLYEMGVNWCCKCGRAFTEGYNDGNPYCSEECYSKDYSEEEFVSIYGEDKTLDDVAFWCSVKTDDRIADAYNRAVFKEEDIGMDMTLVEFMKEVDKGGRSTVLGLQDLMNEMGIRFCDACGKAFVSGYYADMDYYCSDKCKDEAIDPEEWKRLTDPDSEEYSNEYYWTDWEGSQEIADAYNEVFVKQLPEEKPEEEPKHEWELSITERLTKKFKVTADSYAEAFRLLEDAYGKGADINGQSTVLTADDFESKEIY